MPFAFTSINDSRPRFIWDTAIGICFQTIISQNNFIWMRQRPLCVRVCAIEYVALRRCGAVCCVAAYNLTMAWQKVEFSAIRMNAWHWHFIVIRQKMDAMQMPCERLNMYAFMCLSARVCVRSGILCRRLDYMHQPKCKSHRNEWNGRDWKLNLSQAHTHQTILRCCRQSRKCEYNLE